MLIRRPEHLQGPRNRVIARAKVAYAELSNHADDQMQALFRLRYEHIGFRPLRDGRLTIAEQMNQSFHVLAVFAAAEIIFDTFPDCGVLRLSPGVGGGSDVESAGANLVAAEAFTSVDPAFNDKLLKDAQKVNDAMAENGQHFLNRFVYFFSTRSEVENLDLINFVCNEFPQVILRQLSWREIMGRVEPG